MAREDTSDLPDVGTDPVGWEEADEVDATDLADNPDTDSHAQTEDDLPDFVYDDSPVDTVDDDEEPLSLEDQAATDTGTEATSEPWADNPERFDFRDIRDLNERQEAFVRFAQQHPDLATRRDMLYEDYQKTKQEAAAERRELAELRERLAKMEGRLEERGEDSTSEDEGLTKATAELYAFTEQFQAKHDREPTVAEFTQYAVQHNLEPVLAELQEVKGEREAERQKSVQMQEQQMMTEWTEVLRTSPELADPESEQEVSVILAGMAKKRGGFLKPGDVKRAVEVAFGDEIQQERTTQARQVQATRATAVPPVQPGGAGRSPEAGPKSTRLEDVEAFVRKTGVAGMLQKLQTLGKT